MAHTRAPLAALIALAPLALAACALQQDHKRMARVFLTSDHADHALATAAHDVELRIGSEDAPPIPRDEFRRREQWDAALNRATTIKSLHSRGVTAVAEVHETNDFARLIDHPGWDATMIFKYDDHTHGGLISDVLYLPDPQTPSWRPYLEPALPYLRQNHADKLARFFPNDQIVYTAESARAWKSMLTAWRESLEATPTDGT